MEEDYVPSYKKRKGTVNHGNKYEEMASALYALKLIADDNVENFEMTTNNERYGLFDDMAFEITFKNKIKKTFLFQLKHKDNPRCIEKDQLNRPQIYRNSNKPNTDFYVKKYFKSIQDNIQDSQDVICILSTNCPTNIKNHEKLWDNNTVDKIKCDQLEYKDLLLNTQSTDKCPIFQITTADRSHMFYLFTKQNNLDMTTTKVKEVLQNLMCCENYLYESFIHFMSESCSGDLEISKTDIVAKLAELALSPYIKTLNDMKQNNKIIHLKEAIMDHQITFIKETDEDIIESGCQSKNSAHPLSSETGKKFLLDTMESNQIKIDKSNEATIKSVVKLLNKSAKTSKIILIGSATNDFFQGLDIFQNLFDLIKKAENKKYYKSILDTFQVSLQGKEPISLARLVKIDQEIAKYIGVRELLKMSQETYQIGSQQDTPEFHIPRSVSTIFVKTETILNVYRSLNCKIIVIINGNSAFKNELSNKNISSIELSEYLNDTGDGSNNILLLSTEKQCTHADFYQVCNKNNASNVYLFQVFDDELCALLLRKENNSFSGFKNESYSLMEKDVVRKFDSLLNVICAPPGMGKSTTLKVLYNNCPCDCWGIYVDLISYNSFLAKEPNYEQIWDYILEKEVTEKNGNKQLTNCFHKNKNIYLYLDGLDEIDSMCVDRILGFVEYEVLEGTKIWISSRENLQEKISHTLKAVPLKIEKLNKEQQEEYIQEKLKIKYPPEDIKKILDVIFDSTDLVNSQELLGIPLQLYIITEMFLNNDKAYQNLEQKNIFVLTQMYAIFFEGKIEAAVSKVVDNNQRHQLGYLKGILVPYEIPALKQCLNREDFEQLDVDVEETNEFIRQIKKNGDKYGIIKKVNDNDDAIFDHHTYAEYFACIWLKKNKSKTTLLKKVIFSDKYRNLRVMFDVMLAENNPLHLSIIYKNLDQFEKRLDDFNNKDKGGRTALHLLCTYGGIFPQDVKGQFWSKEPDWYAAMNDKLLKKCSNIKNVDDLLNLDYVHYALEARCLYPIEKIIAMHFVSYKDIKKTLFEYYTAETLVSYSAEMGFFNVFNGLVTDSPKLLNHRNCGQSMLEKAVTGTCIDNIIPPREGNVAIINLILECGRSINKTNNFVYNSQIIFNKTILDVACSTGKYDVINSLVENGAKCTNGNTVWHRLSELKNCNKEVLNHFLKEFNEDVNLKNNKGVTPLHLACETTTNSMFQRYFTLRYITLDEIQATCRDIVQFLITEKGSNVNATNCHGTTPLHMSCQNADFQLTKLLLQNGASVNSVDDDNNNALHYAAKSRRDNRDVIKLLIESIDVNSSNSNSTTALHFACKYGNCDNAQFLLTNNALVNATDADGNNALHYALYLLKENTDIIKLLIKNGLNVNCSNNKKTTPFQIACQYSMLENAKTLLKNNADINAVDICNKNALHYTIDYDKEKSFKEIGVHFYGPFEDKTIFKGIPREDFVEVTKLLIDNGTNLNTVDQNGTTALHLACQNNDTEIVQMLLENDASVNIVDQEENNALHFAIKSSFYRNGDIIKMLIEKGININAQNKIGQTALGMASAYGEVQIMERLLGEVALVNILDENDNGMLQYVLMQHCTSYESSLIQLLIDKGADVNVPDYQNGVTALQFACRYACLASVEVLVENNASVNALDNENRNALHHAVISDYDIFGKIKLLINKGIDFNVPDKDGITAFHLACKFGKFDCVKILLENNVSANVLDNNNNNALHYSLRSHDFNQRIVKLLIDKNIELNRPNKDGKTPLHLACRNNYVVGTTMLLERLSSVNNQDENGDNALHHALSSGGTTSANLLINKGININARNEKGITPLHIACKNSDYENILLLLKKNAEIDIVDINGDNALHFVLRSNKQNQHIIIDSLFHKCVDLNRPNNNGTTPLHLACQNGELPTIQKLLQHLSSGNIQEDISSNTLDRTFPSVRSVHTQTFVHQQNDINSKSRNITNDLPVAYNNSVYQSVQVLLKEKIQVDMTDQNGNNALHYAAQSTTINDVLIELLIKTRFNVNCQNKEGITALHFACKAGIFDNVKILFFNGADIELEDKHGNNALHYASQSEHGYKFIHFLIMAGGVDVNSQNKDGSTALHLACQANNMMNVTELLDYDVDVNLLDTDEKIPLDYVIDDKMRNLLESFQKARHK